MEVQKKVQTLLLMIFFPLKGAIYLCDLVTHGSELLMFQHVLSRGIGCLDELETCLHLQEDE